MTIVRTDRSTFACRWPVRLAACTTALVAALCIAASPCASQNAAQSASGEPRVSVDFGKRVKGVRSMSGFLHASDADQPPNSMVLPLKPALWRIGFAWRGNRDRLAKMGIPTVMVLSDIWGYGKTPIQDYSAFETGVRDIAREGRGRGFVWDIWNEPDINGFWKGDEAQYLEAFSHAAMALRAELGPQTLISGPSITHFDGDRIKRFLDYCRDHQIRVDVLSWHELAVDSDIPSIETHLQDARRGFLENPTYASVGIKKIQINEIVGPTAQIRPGEILGYLHYLELGGADGACKGCWDDSHGGSNCTNNTLDGILTPDVPHQPRAAWWAYRTYADTLATRVESSASDRHMVSFAAGPAGTPMARVVVGCFSVNGAPALAPGVVHLDLQGLASLPFLRGRTRIHMKVEKIPDTGEAAVTELTSVQESDETVTQGSASLTVPAPAEHEGLLITLSAPPLSK